MPLKLGSFLPTWQVEEPEPVVAGGQQLAVRRDRHGGVKADAFDTRRFAPTTLVPYPDSDFVVTARSHRGAVGRNGNVREGVFVGFAKGGQFLVGDRVPEFDALAAKDQCSTVARELDTAYDLPRLQGDPFFACRQIPQFHGDGLVARSEGLAVRRERQPANQVGVARQFASLPASR